MVTTRDIITIFVYLTVFLLILFVSKGISWDKIINPRHKVEGTIMSIFIIVALAYCVGSFINALIPHF